MKEEIKNCVETLKKGGVILYPTDTVWGIGCDATNEKAVKKIILFEKMIDVNNHHLFQQVFRVNQTMLMVQ